MIYNSFSFVVIFPLLFLLYYFIPASKQKWRNYYLLMVSYLLYVNWKPAYALILFAVTSLTYLFARWLEIYNNRKAIVVGGGTFDTFAPASVQVL